MPLIAFNNDVEHKGQMFHIQTEDNGLRVGTITSILFLHGQIIETKRTSYKDVLKRKPSDEERDKAIRQRMVDLHREFYNALRAGQYEEQTEKLVGNSKGKGRKSAKRPEAEEALAPEPSFEPATLDSAELRAAATQRRVAPPLPASQDALPWPPTGRSAFRGIVWDTADLRLDGLVAEFLSGQA